LTNDKNHDIIETTPAIFTGNRQTTFFGEVRNLMKVSLKRMRSMLTDNTQMVGWKISSALLKKGIFMNKLFSMVGWGMFILAYGFSLLITASGWAQHMLSWSSGDWHLLKQEADLNTLLSNCNIEREVSLAGDISGVVRVLVLATEPEISVLLDSKGEIVDIRLGMSSIQSSLDIFEIVSILTLLAVSFVLLGKRQQSPNPLLRSFGLWIISLVLCYFSVLLLVHSPMLLYGIIFGLCLFLLAIILSCFAFEHWYWNRET
jgi:hypothetical protein